MPKKVTAKQVKRKGKVVWRVLLPLAMTGGKQQARFFRNKDDAKQHAAMLNGQRSGPVEEFSALTGVAQDFVIRALRVLGGDAQALELAAVEFSKTRKGKADLTLAKLVDECMAAKEAAGIRPRSLGNLKCSLDAFKAGLGQDKPVVMITPQEVGTWLNAQGWSNTTRRGRLVDVRTVLNFAVKQGWLGSNPADGVEKPKRDQTTPGILKVEEAERLMITAREQDPGLVPYIALCLFGGLRPEQEAASVTWDDVRNGKIIVNAATAQGRKRRLVEVNPTLRAWLDLGGDLPVKGLQGRLRRVRELAGIVWSHDCMRHSFVSYALPVRGSMKVAMWSGHSEAVLHQHYKELVHDDEAKRFWGLMPKR